MESPRRTQKPVRHRRPRSAAPETERPSSSICSILLYRFSATAWRGKRYHKGRDLVGPKGLVTSILAEIRNYAENFSTRFHGCVCARACQGWGLELARVVQQGSWCSQYT